MRKLKNLLKLTQSRYSLLSQSHNNKPLKFPHKPFQNPCLKPFLLLPPHSSFFPKFSPLFQTSFCSSTSSHSSQNTPSHDSDTDRDLVIEEWEEEDDTEPEVGDGGAGGGIVLQNVPWGENVLSIAHEVLQQFGDDIKLYAFKTTPRGYIYIRLDKLSHQYGCPSMEEVENYSREYKKRLEEEGSKGLIPEDLALEVSSPGAERLLRVPDDLRRFKDFPMVVSYVEGDTGAKIQENTRIFFLDAIETESEHCIWKLADVSENRDPASKGRPLNRKQRDLRFKLPYSMLKKVTLYLD